MEINEILKNRRIELNLTQLDVAKAVGVSEATVSRWESGNIANMKRSRIAALAQILQIKPGVIMGLEGENESKNENISTIEKGIKIPVLGSVRAGIPLEAIEDIVDYEEIPEVMARNGEYFGLLVKGDSMSPVFIDGDTVIVRKQESADTGDSVIAMINGDEATIKRLKRTEDGIILIPNNPQYLPMTYSNDQIKTLPVRILGKVVELRRKF